MGWKNNICCNCTHGGFRVALLTGILANAFSNQIARRKLIFEDQIREALEDGVVDALEVRSLEQLRKDFGLSKQQADALMRHVQLEKKQKTPEK